MDKISPKIVVEYKVFATVVTLTQEKILEDMEITAIEHSIMPLINDADTVKMIINFSNVKFLSSAVLGLLIRISKKIYEKQGQLRLCCIDPKILNVFKITRLDRVFEIYDTQDQAIASFS